MTTANSPNNNLRPWKPGQSGNPTGMPRGTRDLAGYVLESTDAGRELIDALGCLARGVMPNVAALKGLRQVPPQLDIAHSVSDRPLEHLSDETLRLLVESARQLEEASGVVVDGVVR